MENGPQGDNFRWIEGAAAAAVPIKTQPCDGLKPEQKKAEIRAPGADFAEKRRVAGFLSYLARSAPGSHPLCARTHRHGIMQTTANALAKNYGGLLRGGCRIGLT